MYGMYDKLKLREKEGNPIQVGIIGVGQMGAEIVATIGEMDGMRAAVTVDLTIERAAAAHRQSRRPVKVTETNDPDAAAKAVAEGGAVAATDFSVATRLPQVDVVVDATGSAEMGAVCSLDAIHHKKHVVMMSVECDVTIGPILKRMADDAGVVYGMAAGDEPAAIMEVWRFARSMGFEVVCAGKGKNNPLNIHATPDDVLEKANARRMSAKMLCEFVDGSKTAIEMAAVSNATGLVPDVRGMHAAKAAVPELNRVFVPRKDGGVLERSGVVDFAIGVHPGVFLIVKTDNPCLVNGLSQRDMGSGPYYTLYRPYHLCSIEVPLTAANCVLYGESSGHPGPKLISECIAITKRDLKAGEALDGIGEYSYRGSIDLAATAIRENLLPLGLARGYRLKRDVGKDRVLAYDMVELDADSPLRQLRRLQDALRED
ncbi:MAG: NAD(P)-dependent oxidoreductase [Planctomycetota bacterium]|jgi:predicted homoserine dehydrogenase-like protein|nr:NAD(P)-dependent oxidoreductase [Planctomycetota bacterium]